MCVWLLENACPLSVFVGICQIMPILCVCVCVYAHPLCVCVCVMDMSQPRDWLYSLIESDGEIRGSEELPCIYLHCWTKMHRFNNTHTHTHSKLKDAHSPFCLSRDCRLDTHTHTLLYLLSLCSL